MMTTAGTAMLAARPFSRNAQNRAQREAVLDLSRGARRTVALRRTLYPHCSRRVRGCAADANRNFCVRWCDFVSCSGAGGYLGFPQGGRSDLLICAGGGAGRRRVGWSATGRVASIDGRAGRHFVLKLARGGETGRGGSWVRDCGRWRKRRCERGE